MLGSTHHGHHHPTHTQLATDLVLTDCWVDLIVRYLIIKAELPEPVRVEQQRPSHHCIHDVKLLLFFEDGRSVWDVTCEAMRMTAEHCDSEAV